MQECIALSENQTFSNIEIFEMTLKMALRLQNYIDKELPYLIIQKPNDIVKKLVETIPPRKNQDLDNSWRFEAVLGEKHFKIFENFDF